MCLEILPKSYLVVFVERFDFVFWRCSITQHVPVNASENGSRRNTRSFRWRISSLFCWRILARSTFWENALWQWVTIHRVVENVVSVRGKACWAWNALIFKRIGHQISLKPLFQICSETVTRGCFHQSRTRPQTFQCHNGAYLALYCTVNHLIEFTENQM